MTEDRTMLPKAVVMPEPEMSVPVEQVREDLHRFEDIPILPFHFIPQPEMSVPDERVPRMVYVVEPPAANSRVVRHRRVYTIEVRVDDMVVRYEAPTAEDVLRLQALDKQTYSRDT